MGAPNIILITIDSLRYDHLGCYGYHRNTSPNIDALAARGVKFMQAISNGGNTAYAFPSILASALPPLGKTESKAGFKASATLSGLLRSDGYSTAAFHSNPLLSHFYGYGEGFDIFDDSFHHPEIGNESPVFITVGIQIFPGGNEVRLDNDPAVFIYYIWEAP